MLALDRVLIGLFSCVILQILLGLLRILLVHVCKEAFTDLTCYVLTLKSQSSILWYVFLNIVSFHIVRLTLAHKLSCGVATFLFVHNLYAGIVLYYLLSLVDVEFV